MGAEHTRPLTELRRADESLFGGKSASLGELIAAGIPVPPGFALASTAFEATGLSAEIDGRLAGLDVADLEALRSSSAAIAELVRATPMPEPVRGEVERRYEAIGGEASPVAVRSSAVGEDSADATFAGQQESYLWVRGAERVCDAVRDCWASLYTPEAISYRSRMPSAEPAMGVAVQLMVDAAVSGVLFTCNPVSGDPSAIAVNASWGLGLAVVGGEVTPDDYRVSKVTGEVLHRTVGSKEVEYVPGANGAQRADVPAERRSVPCLGEEQLGALVELGRRVERHFGAHQDVEWAIDRDGEPFVLQSRPVTVARRRADPPARSAMDLVMNTFGARKDQS
jgi:pyruvate, water dikinase